MRRKHLFEFGDQRWLPAVLREGIQNFLNASHRSMGFFREWADILAKEVLPTVKTRSLIDLCSGAGGPSPLVRDELQKRHGINARLTMTDLCPNQRAKQWLESVWGDDVRYLSKPVNAADVPEELEGIRTVFNGFHHMTPELAERILQDAFRRQTAICVFEYNRNSWLAVISSVFYPILVLMLMPFARPTNFWQLALTYIVPVLPLLIAWDGFVSNLRCYSTKEFEELTNSMRRDDYEWKSGCAKKRGYPIGLVYFIGRPKSVDGLQEMHGIEGRQVGLEVALCGG